MSYQLADSAVPAVRPGGHKPVISPWFFEPPVPYPHWYRYGPDYTRAMFLSESAEGAYTRNPTAVLGAVPDWRCWERPGFKDCQANCYKKAQAASTDPKVVEPAIEACFQNECVKPCETSLATGSESGSAPTGGSALSPLKLGLIGLGAVALLALATRKPAVKQNKRRARRSGRK